jgi:hypothetical protein
MKHKTYQLMIPADVPPAPQHIVAGGVVETEDPPPIPDTSINTVLSPNYIQAELDALTAPLERQPGWVVTTLHLVTFWLPLLMICFVLLLLGSFTQFRFWDLLLTVLIAGVSLLGAYLLLISNLLRRKKTDTAP